MKRLAAGLLSLAIAAAVHAPAHAAPAARPLAMNGETSGEITSSTPINHSDGTRSALFSLQLAAGQAVSLTLEGPLKGSLAVFTRDTLVSRTESDGDSEGSTTLSIRAEKAGQYTVAVSGADARAFGPFQLSVEPIVAYDGKPLVAGRRVTDWLRQESKEYTLEVDKAGLYTLTMDSSEIDSRLELSGNGINMEDDDGGNQLNARLVAPLQPGRYTITANAVNEASGAFYLGVERTDFPEGLVFEDGTALPPDGKASGFINADDTRSFTLNLPERRRVQLDASSRDLDTLLTLKGADIVLSDDDGGGNVNSRLTQVLEAGEYTVSVRSVNGRGGVFELSSATSAAAEGPSRQELKLSREVQGQLRPGNRDLYTLEIPRKGNYVITMVGANGLDGMLTLMRDGEEVAQQDDGDDSLDPTLEVELEAGRYVLLAHSFDSSATGSYRLLARRK